MVKRVKWNYIYVHWALIFTHSSAPKTYVGMPTIISISKDCHDIMFMGIQIFKVFKVTTL